MATPNGNGFGTFPKTWSSAKAGAAVHLTPGVTKKQQKSALSANPMLLPPGSGRQGYAPLLATRQHFNPGITEQQEQQFSAQPLVLTPGVTKRPLSQADLTSLRESNQAQQSLGAAKLPLSVSTNPIPPLLTPGVMKPSSPMRRSLSQADLTSLRKSNQVEPSQGAAKPPLSGFTNPISPLMTPGIMKPSLLMTLGVTKPSSLAGMNRGRGQYNRGPSRRGGGSYRGWHRGRPYEPGYHQGLTNLGGDSDRGSDTSGPQHRPNWSRSRGRGRPYHHRGRPYRQQRPRSGGSRSSEGAELTSGVAEISSSDQATAEWVAMTGRSGALRHGSHSSGASSDGNSNCSDACSLAVPNEDSFSDSVPAPDEIIIDSAAAMLSNLPPDVSLDTLANYLEVATGCTATAVSILFRSDRRSAVVNFSDDIDVENLQRFVSEVPLDDDALYIEIDEVEEASAVQLNGLPPSWTEDIIRMFFENNIMRCSLLASVAKVQIVYDTAVVALTTSTGFKMLLESLVKNQQQNSSVAPFYKCLGLTRALDLTTLTPPPGTPPISEGSSNGLTLFVSGFSKPAVSENRLRSFFVSEQSGGADCIEKLCLLDEGILVLRYSDPEVAQCVIDKACQRKLEFESDILWVAVKSSKLHPLMDKHIFILRNLPSNACRATLLYFLWAKASSPVSGIYFSHRRNTALIEFESDSECDFDRLNRAVTVGLRLPSGSNQELASDTPEAAELLQVPPIACVQVSGIPEKGSEQYAELLIDDACSCSCTVEAAIANGACAFRLASSEEFRAVRSSSLDMDGVRLEVAPYHDLTGLTAVDEMSVRWLLPSFSLGYIDASVLNFVTSSKNARSLLEGSLRNVGGLLAKAGDSYLVECVADMSSISGGVASFRSSWCASMARAVDAFFSGYCSAPIDVDTKNWPEVKKALLDAGFPNSNVNFTAEEDAGEGVQRVVFAGARAAVKAASERAAGFVAEQVSREVAERSKAAADSETSGGGILQIQVDRSQLLYLQYKNIASYLKQHVDPALVVKTDPSGSVFLSGPAEAIDKGVAYIRDKLTGLSFATITLEACAVELAVQREGYQHMVTSFKLAGLAAFYERAEDREIKLRAESVETMKAAVLLLREQIRTRELVKGADERSRAVLSTPEFKAKIAELKRRWQRQAVVISVSEDSLAVAATAPNSRAISDVTELWESMQAGTPDVIAVDDILVFSLLRFHLRTLLGQNGRYVSFEEKGARGEVVVAAPPVLSATIYTEIRTILSKVRRGWMLIQGTPAVDWLTAAMGKKFLSACSARLRTFARYFKTERLLEKKRDDGRRVVVVCGSPLLQLGQCLMIGTNAKLELSASTSGSQLLYLGGQGIQNQCNDIVKNRQESQRQDGHSFCTHASKWPFNAIMHVICPNHHPDPLQAKDDLFVFAIMKGFELVANKKYSSVVLPCIGSDGFGFPAKISAELLLRAMDMHFKDNPQSSIQEVTVADLSKDATAALCRELKTQISRSPTDATDQPGNGLVVEVIHGKLESQQVDTIVNGLLDHGDLSTSGAVSQQLSRVAGPELQQACRRLAPGARLEVGRTLVTKGYALPCKQVINICCGRRDSTSSPTVLKNHIVTCLTKAEELHASTIAIPAVGIDALNVSPSALAQATFEAIRSHKPRHLKIVKCVLDEEPTYKVFFEKQKAIFGTGRSSPPENPTISASLCLVVLGLSEESVQEAIKTISDQVEALASKRSSN